MSLIACIFPGQGSQTVGMGKDFYENDLELNKLFKKSDQILNYELTKLVLKGPSDILNDTKNAQISIFINSYIILKAFLKKIKNNNLLKNQSLIYGGHSLGEFTAYCSSGVINFETTLKIVKKRGQLMSKEGKKNKGLMAAIIGIDNETVIEICKKSSKEGLVYPANFNCPGQIVISGEKKAIEKSMYLAKKAKAKLVKILNVSGAFHSPLMKKAAENFSCYIDKLELSQEKIPVISNVTANRVEFKNLKNNFKKHMLSAVLWEKSIKQMINMGANIFIEIGHGKVLQGLIKKIDSSVKTMGIYDINSLNKTIEDLKNLI